MFLCVKTLMTSPDAARAKVCVCVPTALAGTAAGEASGVFYPSPFCISCFTPLVPILTLLWEQKLWLENELGTDRVGEKGLPMVPVKRKVLPVLSCAPQSSRDLLGRVFTLWEM